MFLGDALWMRIRSIVLITLLIFGFFFSTSVVWAKTPPEIRNQDELVISPDMHGLDLKGLEFVKTDLRGVDLSGSDLRGAVFNNSQLQGANLNSADLEDVVAFASLFEGADLRDVNFTNALLMESTFSDALIEGADFTNAVLNRVQQKELCSMAEGSNKVTGESTSYSLGC